jgi:DNA-binding MarR family transcriptional regulator
MTRWLDETELRAWRGFVTLHAQLNARLNRQLQADSGLSLADYEVLVFLTDSPTGRRRIFELGRAMQWEQSRLSHHLKRMAGRGLVARENCTEDGRGAHVVVTEAGRRSIEAAAPGHVEAVRRYFLDELTRGQIEALAGLSERALERLRPLDAQPDCADR